MTIKRKNKLAYLWNRVIKKMPGVAYNNISFEYPSKIEARSTAINVEIGRYSYCGYSCVLHNCRIGNFCSIADNVKIGLSSHPMHWVSTSPAFYYGKDSIPKDMAKMQYNMPLLITNIEHDVWIGEGALIKSGVTIRTGSVVAMGSVVTKDVSPYSIVGGNPAKIIGFRFPEEIIKRLMESKWWEIDLDTLKKYAHFINEPEKFLGAIEGRV